MFPAEDPKGGTSSSAVYSQNIIKELIDNGIDPAMWADSELKSWLERVSSLFRLASVCDFHASC